MHPLDYFEIRGRPIEFLGPTWREDIEERAQIGTALEETQGCTATPKIPKDAAQPRWVIQPALGAPCSSVLDQGTGWGRHAYADLFPNEPPEKETTLSGWEVD